MDPILTFPCEGKGLLARFRTRDSRDHHRGAGLAGDVLALVAENGQPFLTRNLDEFLRAVVQL